MEKSSDTICSVILYWGEKLQKKSSRLLLFKCKYLQEGYPTVMLTHHAFPVVHIIHKWHDISFTAQIYYT